MDPSRARAVVYAILSTEDLGALVDNMLTNAAGEISPEDRRAIVAAADEVATQLHRRAGAKALAWYLDLLG
jgi:hypothetical protein